MCSSCVGHGVTITLSSSRRSDGETWTAAQAADLFRPTASCASVSLSVFCSLFILGFLTAASNPSFKPSIQSLGPRLGGGKQVAYPPPPPVSGDHLLSLGVLVLGGPATRLQLQRCWRATQQRLRLARGPSCKHSTHALWRLAAGELIPAASGRLMPSIAPYLLGGWGS